MGIEELYNEKGQVNDPEVARIMAKTEDPYHKKSFFILKPSESKLREGEAEAERVGDRIKLNEELAAQAEENGKFFENLKNIDYLHDRLLYLGKMRGDITEGKEKVDRWGWVNTTGGPQKSYDVNFNGSTQVDLGQKFGELTFEISDSEHELSLNGLPLNLYELDNEKIKEILDKIREAIAELNEKKDEELPAA